MSINPSAILWDMDGTIIDTEPAWIKAEQALLARFGLELREEDLLEWVGIGLWDLADIFIARGVSMAPDEIVLDLTYGVNEIVFGGPEMPWRPGAVELLGEFKALGIPNVLVTMATKSQAEKVLSKLPQGTFAEVLGGDEVPKPKPHPDPYLLGAKRLGFRASECVAIEDSVTGVQAAVAAGSFVIGVKHLVDLDNSGADVILNSLDGIKATDIVKMFYNR